MKTIKGAASWEDRDLADLFIGIGLVVIVALLVVAAIVGIVGGLLYVIAR